MSPGHHMLLVDDYVYKGSPMSFEGLVRSLQAEHDHRKYGGIVRENTDLVLRELDRVGELKCEAMLHQLFSLKRDMQSIEEQRRRWQRAVSPTMTLWSIPANWKKIFP